MSGPEGEDPELRAAAVEKFDPVAHDAMDPWRHRAMSMRCSTCMWYVPKHAVGDEREEIGRCRRRAPTMGGYPVVFPIDWCGDHKLDEAKM